ncbi:MAG: succinylglutamate desuccinylase/aspartoacylase family protein [Deltaproteobacteria bacterium]|nr:succinylglutamate desuccinylase/aspartoacylase family protein [Deltaproteobacteria bacterium]
MSALGAYPDEDERERELEQLSARAGGVLVTIGHSVGGRPIRAVRVPSTTRDAPRVLVNANIHGPEHIGSRVAMAVLRGLAEERADELRRAAEVVVLPCVNVDGFARTVARAGRGTLKELRCNDHGVDLNRNFPLPTVGDAGSLWGLVGSRELSIAGSRDPARATWRGPHPLSEPEAKALHDFAIVERFSAAVSLHSYMGTFIPPCVRSVDEARAYARLVTRARCAQRRRYLRFQWGFFDMFTGELEDFLHHETGTWAVTLECFTLWQTLRQHLRAPTLFARFNPADPRSVVANDAPAVIAFLLAALELPHPRRGATEAIDPAP